MARRVARYWIPTRLEHSWYSRCSSRARRAALSTALGIYHYASQLLHPLSPSRLRHVVICLGPVRFGDRCNDGTGKSAAFETGFFGHGAILS